MTDSSASLTPTDVMAAASQALTEGHYQQIVRTFPAWDTLTSRLFEDEYSIVGISVFDTCGDLIRTWPDLQGALVEVISKRVGVEESKAWDGYLVLLSTGIAPSEGAAIESIRYNTVRLRKLVATGEDLHNSSDIERVLSPLLPLVEEQATVSQESVLDLLPVLLSNQDIPNRITQTLVDAFREQSPLLERLHQIRGEQ
jgi:hypothetical protein